VKKASEYRQHAEECRALARTSRTPDERAQLDHLARTWDGLAVDRERIVREQAALDKMESTDTKAQAPAHRPPPLVRKQRHNSKQAKETATFQN
jgi:hypothetical protein